QLRRQRQMCIRDSNTTETFELTESDSKQSYQFDNIDIVAMEIYDLIQ
ncbi:YkuJ family protein, partial [Enterococcus sp. S181_ASV_20]|nr:YkuJ family protein [Enterococcus sp. S181_ASV_20]